MPRGRAFSRYLFREKHKKQYTFTKTKMIVGFFLSVITSIFLGTYLESYGPTILKQGMAAFHDSDTGTR